MTQIKPLSSMETPRFADVATFFRLPVIKDLNKLDYCVAGVPWDGGTTNRPGARHGPREIRNASSLVRLYHPVSLKSPYDKFNIADIGDCPVNPADLNDSLDKIFLDKGQLMILLPFIYLLQIKRSNELLKKYEIFFFNSDGL